LSCSVARWRSASPPQRPLPSLGAWCLKVFAEHSEHEFALFERRLGSNDFPAPAKAQVDALAATARHLTKLFQQLDADPRPGETLGKIAVGVVTLDHEYAALVHKLS
jgi:hypothetical protein